jgi:hypothetical protein
VVPPRQQSPAVGGEPLLAALVDVAPLVADVAALVCAPLAEGSPELPTSPVAPEGVVSSSSSLEPDPEPSPPACGPAQPPTIAWT